LLPSILQEKAKAGYINHQRESAAYFLLLRFFLITSFRKQTNALPNHRKRNAMPESAKIYEW